MEINGSPQGQVALPLRVFRVAPGTSILVRTLASSYKGFLTHYYRGRSRVCLANECDVNYHKIPTDWKGYTPVEIWEGTKAKWFPVVLEITEHLELDFRHLFQRGQIWEVYREIVGAKKGTPVCGKLMEELDPKRLPPAFDVIRTVRSMYKCHVATLHLDSPLPDRILMGYSEGAAPACTESAAKTEHVDRRPLAEALKDYNDKKKSPHTNGKHN